MRQAALRDVRARREEVAELLARARSVSAAQGVAYSAPPLAAIGDAESTEALRQQLARLNEAAAGARVAIVAARERARVAVAREGERAREARAPQTFNRDQMAEQLRQLALGQREKRVAELKQGASEALQQSLDEAEGLLMGLRGEDVDQVRAEIAAASLSGDAAADLSERARDIAAQAHRRADLDYKVDVIQEVLSAHGWSLGPEFLTGEPASLVSGSVGMVAQLQRDTGEILLTPAIVQTDGQALTPREKQAAAMKADAQACREAEALMQKLAQRGVRNRRFRAEPLKADQMPILLGAPFGRGNVASETLDETAHNKASQ